MAVTILNLKALNGICYFIERCLLFICSFSRRGLFVKITVGLDVRVRGFVSWRARSNLRAAITASSLRRRAAPRRAIKPHCNTDQEDQLWRCRDNYSTETLIVSKTVTVLPFTF